MDLIFSCRHKEKFKSGATPSALSTQSRTGSGTFVAAGLVSDSLSINNCFRIFLKPCRQGKDTNVYRNRYESQWQLKSIIIIPCQIKFH